MRTDLTDLVRRALLEQYPDYTFYGESAYIPWIESLGTDQINTMQLKSSDELFSLLQAGDPDGQVSGGLIIGCGEDLCYLGEQYSVSDALPAWLNQCPESPITCVFWTRGYPQNADSIITSLENATYGGSGQASCVDIDSNPSSPKLFGRFASWVSSGTMPSDNLNVAGYAEHLGCTVEDFNSLIAYGGGGDGYNDYVASGGQCYNENFFEGTMNDGIDTPNGGPLTCTYNESGITEIDTGTTVTGTTETGTTETSRWRCVAQGQCVSGDNPLWPYDNQEECEADTLGVCNQPEKCDKPGIGCFVCKADPSDIYPDGVPTYSQGCMEITTNTQVDLTIQYGLPTYASLTICQLESYCGKDKEVRWRCVAQGDCISATNPLWPYDNQEDCESDTLGVCKQVDPDSETDRGCMDKTAINYGECCDGDPKCTVEISEPSCCQYDEVPDQERYDCVEGWGAASGQNFCDMNPNGEYETLEECESECTSNDGCTELESSPENYQVICCHYVMYGAPPAGITPVEFMASDCDGVTLECCEGNEAVYTPTEIPDLPLGDIDPSRFADMSESDGKLFEEIKRIKELLK